jgi:hypothetical protein
MRHRALLAVTLLTAGLPALAATGPSARGEARLAKALDGRTAGKPVRCLNLRDIRSSEIIDRTAILYRTGGGRVYVNRPQIGRESLDDNDILVTRTFGSQLCSIDTVRLIDRNARFYSGFVGLGEFVPYTKVAERR